MLKIILVCILLTLIATSTAFAQGQALPPLEIITADNINRIKELARWEVFSAAAFTPDGQSLAIALDDGFIHFLSLPSLETERSLAGADFGASELRFSRDGSRLLLFGGPLALWDVNSGQQIYQHEYMTDDFRYMVDADFHNLMLERKDLSLTVINMDTGDEIFAAQSAEVTPFPQLDATGSFLSLVDEDGNLVVWDISIGSIKYQFEPPAGAEPDGRGFDLDGFGFSPDGHLIWANWHDWLFGREDLSKNHSIIQFWNSTDGSEAFTLDASGGHSRMYFSPTGNIIATAGESDWLTDDVWVWNLNEKKLLGNIGATGGGVPEFSPTGELLAVACGTCSLLQILDLQAQDQPDWIWTIETNGYVTPSFSPDGQLLLTVGQYIQLWGVPKN